MKKKLPFFLLSTIFLTSCSNYSLFDLSGASGKIEKENKVETDKINAQKKIELDKIEKVKDDAEQIKIKEENKIKAAKKSEEMVLVDSGKVLIVHNPNKLISISLNKFYIGKYEVDRGLYKTIMGDNSIPKINYNAFYLEDESFLALNNVSWYDAIKFCNLKSKKESLSIAYNEKTGELLDEKGNVTTDITKVKGYRLPTEVEWEYAARGGNKSQNFQYSGSNNIEEVGWFNEIANSEREIGTKKPNELGIYDMTGNVAEWCQDWYSEKSFEGNIQDNYYNNTKTAYKTIRGSGWGGSRKSQIVFERNFSTPSDGYNYIGFRIARSY